MKRFIIVLVSLTVLNFGLHAQSKAEYVKAIEMVFAEEDCQVLFQAKVNGKPTVLVKQTLTLAELNISSEDFKSANRQILIWGKEDFFMAGMKYIDGTNLYLKGNGTSIDIVVMSSPIKQQENKRFKTQFFVD